MADWSQDKQYANIKELTSEKRIILFEQATVKKHFEAKDTFLQGIKDNVMQNKKENE